MAVGKKITELSKAVKTNLSSDGTLVYVVNNNVSKQVDLDNLLFDGIITSNKIAANAITADKIAANAITVDKITTATIEAIKISAADIDVNSIIAQVISSLVINGNQIFANSITADQIAANSITADQIAANTITADHIFANSITADQIAANTITADHIFANSITADQIAACSITATHISACSIGATQIQSGAITSQAIASNIVITGSIQSRNFDGFNLVNEPKTGEEILQYLDAGTQGFFLDERTGTAVFTDIIARDNIISANYIKYNENSGLSAIDADGNFGVRLDNDTLQIEDGRVKIKQIPSNFIVDQSLYLNNNTVFFGQEATEVFALPPMQTWIDPPEAFNAADIIYNKNAYYGGDVRDNILIESPPEVYPTGVAMEILLLHIDLFDYVDSADQINGNISLNNVKFYIDLTNYASINNIDSFTFQAKSVVSSTLGNTDSYTSTTTYLRNTVANPTMLPRVYEIVTDINCGSIKVNNNSRYLSIYTYHYINVPNGTTDQDNPVTQYIGISAEFNTDTNFRFDVYGAVPADRIHSLSEITRLAPGRQIGFKFVGFLDDWTIVNAEWSSADYIMDPTFYGPYTPLSWTPYV